jgi:hypothetical protein
MLVHAIVEIDRPQRIQAHSDREQQIAHVVPDARGERSHGRHPL